MPYADSDFFLAILKKDDWLKEKAEKILKENRDKIWTSDWTVVELLMLAKEYGLDEEKLVFSMSTLSEIDGDINKLLSAAHLMKEKGLTTFDALHASSVGDDFIISSDSVYDKIGLKRIKLEK